MKRSKKKKREHVVPGEAWDTGFLCFALLLVLGVLFGSLVIGIATFMSFGSMSKGISSSGSTSPGQPSLRTNFNGPHTRAAPPTVELSPSSDIESEIEEGGRIALSLVDSDAYNVCMDLEETTHEDCIEVSKVFTKQEGKKPSDKPRSSAKQEGKKPSDKSRSSAKQEGKKPSDKPRSSAKQEGKKPSDKPRSSAKQEGKKPSDKSRSSAKQEGKKPSDKSRPLPSNDTPETCVYLKGKGVREVCLTGSEISMNQKSGMLMTILSYYH